MKTIKYEITIICEEENETADTERVKDYVWLLLKDNLEIGLSDIDVQVLSDGNEY